MMIHLIYKSNKNTVNLLGRKK